MFDIATLVGLRPQDLRRLVASVLMILIIFIAGVAGYSTLADLSLGDALYMTVITISTVGFAELGDFDTSTRIFSSLLIIFTIVWGAWALQSVLGTLLSPQFRMGVGQIRAVRKAQKMQNHTIICGYGRIGRAVAAEMNQNGERFVIIEHDLDMVETLREQKMHAVHGDAREDETLIAAGIQTAKRLVSVLDTDNANIVTVLSARELNPSLWIASRVVQPESQHKLTRAGANEVVSPYEFGGRRLALTILRPHVSEFLAEVVFDEGRGAEMDEVPVLPGSALADWTLGDVKLRTEFDVTVIALYHPDAENHGHAAQGFELNPGPNTTLHEGDVLILVGTKQQLEAVHKALGA